MKTEQNTTLQYYSRNKDLFRKDTQKLSFDEIQNRFMACLKSGSRILDFGCGAGRDVRFFLDHGFDVDGIDGNPDMCQIASEYSGIHIQQMLFEELEAADAYDGIWACSSLLHIPYEDLGNILIRINKALKENGIFYCSFKYGEFEGMRNGRYFTDLNEEKFQTLLQVIPGFEIIREWISKDIRPGRGNEKWLNILLKKRSA